MVIHFSYYRSASIWSKSEDCWYQQGCDYYRCRGVLEGVAPRAVQGGGQGAGGEEEQGGGGHCSRKRIFYHQPDPTIECYFIMLIRHIITGRSKDSHEVQITERVYEISANSI